MGKVRSFNYDDIPQIIELNKKLFPESATLTTEAQKYIFNEVCFHNPWYDPAIASLVYQEDNGKISGFLGIVPRRMIMDGKSLSVAVGQHLMVDKSTLASVQLSKKFISGPQDLSITDRAVDVARTIWERFGGLSVFHYSIYWRRPFLPLSFIASFLKKKKPLTNLVNATTPIWKTFDAIIKQIPVASLRPIKPNVIAEDLTVDSFLEHLPRFTNGWKLKPEYTIQSIGWLFNILTQEKRFGTFQKILLRDESNNVLGWYLYNLQVGGKSEVIQIVGLRETINRVIDHLYYHAWKGGAVELCGRLEPKFMKEFTGKFCLFTPGRNWMLIHSRHPEIIQTIQSGESFLTRLEGDLWFF